MKYKVGDKVRIVKNWDKVNKSYVNPEGKMDYWLGQVMTIKRLDGNHYKMVEDITEHCGGWNWFEDMIEELATPFMKSNLKTGDVVLFKNSDVGIIITETDSVIMKDKAIHLFDISTDLKWGSNPIVEIRRPNSYRDCHFRAFTNYCGDVIYRYSEPEEMTLAEVCKLLGKEIKIIK